MFEPGLKALASLRLTVTCLAFAFVLVLAGTLAQVNEGLYQAQARYFRSVVVWWSAGDGALRIPVLPGGYTVGLVLLVNLIVAHLKRFGLSRRRLGLLLVGQLFTDLLARESTLRLKRGDTANYSEDFNRHELVLVDTNDASTDLVIGIPQARLARKSDIRDARLPVTVRVREFWPNARVFTQPTHGAVPITVS
jgi:hypothetical protein